MIEENVKFTELNYGDVIDLFDGNSDSQYGHATVTRIDDDVVTVVRPYIHTSSFITTAGIIPYIGREDVLLYKSHSRTYTRLYQGKGIR